MSIVWRAGFRFLWRHPWQSGLTVVGIALGVAVVVAIDLANSSTRRAFGLAGEQVSGAATHRLIGGPRGVPETVYRDLQLRPLGVALAPVVEDYVALAGESERMLRLMGVDPFAESAFRSFVSTGTGQEEAIFALLTRPGAVLLGRETADELGLRPGDRFLVTATAGQVRELSLAGYLTIADPARRPLVRGLLLADVSTAQELLQREGWLDHVDVRARSAGAVRRELADLRGLLPPAVSLVASESRLAAHGRMTEALQLNLSALSFLALLVGMFLIYNTMSFSVVRRRRVLGTLRVLGLGRGRLFRLVLGEALLLGAVGAALGLGLGVLLAQVLTALVTRTINDLYFVLAVRELFLDPMVLWKGIGLGLLAALVAALPSALEAARAEPARVLNRSVLETSAHLWVRRAVLAGLAMAVTVPGFLLWPGNGLLPAYAALVALVLAAALATPWLMCRFVRPFGPLLARHAGVLNGMAVRGIEAHLSRTSVAGAALVVAVAATVGVGVMVGSFRATVVHWLETSLRADIYIASERAFGAQSWPPLPAPFAAQVSGLDGVAAVAAYRRVGIESKDGWTDLVAARLPARAEGKFRFVEGDPEAAWNAFQAGEGVLVSEPFAFRHGLRAGDRLVLRTDRGPAAFPVAGVFYDYRSDQGVVYLQLDRYRREWHDGSVSSLAVFLEPGVSTERAMARVRALVPAGYGMMIRANRELREISLEVFERTFTVTLVLKLLAVVVAFVGILSALMALQLERARDVAVLRAIGLEPRQVVHIVLVETGVTGLMSGLLALPVGIGMAAILTRVVNYRAFGWTLQWSLEPGVLLQAVALAVLAGLLAGLYPGFRMARARPALALRGE